MTASYYLSLLLFLPVGGALLLRCLPSRSATAKWGARVVALVTFLLSTSLWIWYSPKNPDFQFVERSRWIPAIGAEFLIGVDGISILFILLTTLLVLIAVLSLSPTERTTRSHVALLLLESGLLGVLMSLDLLLLFGFWQLMLFSMYFLIGDHGPAGRQSAIRFVRFWLAGSALLVLGIVTVYFHHHSATGVYTFELTKLLTTPIPRDLQQWIFVAFVIGFGIAMPLFPFHQWLPGAQRDTPTAASIILTGVMLKTGSYGLMRVSLPLLPDATRELGPYVAVLAILAVLYGAFRTLQQRDWNGVIAFVSVSQMGLATLGLFALNPSGIAGSIVQQISHGLSTADVALLAGAFAQQPRARDMTDYDGPARPRPAAAGVLFALTLMLTAVPLVGGQGSSLLLQGIFTQSRVWAALALGGGVLAAAGTFRLYAQTMSGEAGHRPGDHSTPPGVVNWATVLPLTVLALWVGVRPAALLERINVSSLKLAAHMDPRYEGEFAAACDTAVTPELKAASPANRFLAAAPCGPDGQPLEPGTSSPVQPPPAPR
jgi:NADH-quinone oxidoreductase subunit M